MGRHKIPLPRSPNRSTILHKFPRSHHIRLLQTPRPRPSQPHNNVEVLTRCNHVLPLTLHQQRAPTPRQRRHLHHVPVHGPDLRRIGRDTLLEQTMAVSQDMDVALHDPRWEFGLRDVGLLQPVHSHSLRLGGCLLDQHDGRLCVCETCGDDHWFEHLGACVVQQFGSACSVSSGVGCDG
ncbi:hypothetical protein LINGRAHAP2_LOCUS9777 [Linum grandiflorum]